MSRLVASLRRHLRSRWWLQVAILIGVWYLGTQAARATGLPLSGGVVGLAVVLALLLGRVVALDSLAGGADRLLATMGLFFVPAALGVLDHPELRGLAVVKVLVVLVVSTAAVMLVTGLVVELGLRRRPPE